MWEIVVPSVHKSLHNKKVINKSFKNSFYWRKNKRVQGSLQRLVMDFVQRIVNKHLAASFGVVVINKTGNMRTFWSETLVWRKELSTDPNITSMPKSFEYLYNILTKNVKVKIICIYFKINRLLFEYLILLFF